MTLATIRQISELRPIPNADAIEAAVIDGWTVVVKKGEFEVYDLCVYFEIDSFLPAIPQFAFLGSTKSYNGRDGYRLRTVKLRGQVSQGLALPFSAFEEFNLGAQGNDVTEMLDVIKYEKPIAAELRGSVKGYMPSFLRKTDEERIQNVSESELESLMDHYFIETLKLDGSSMTVFSRLNPAESEDEQDLIEVGVCSRNMEIKDSEGNAFWAAANRYGLPEALRKFCQHTGRSVAVQGELHGEGIQKNNHNLQGRHFQVFNVWDIDEQRYLTYAEVGSIIGYVNAVSKAEPLEYVPVYRIAPLNMLGKSRADFLARADEVYDIGRDKGWKLEGLVFKSQKLINGEIYSFKVVSNKFLLNGGEE